MNTAEQQEKLNLLYKLSKMRDCAKALYTHKYHQIIDPYKEVITKAMIASNCTELQAAIFLADEIKEKQGASFTMMRIFAACLDMIESN